MASEEDHISVFNDDDDDDDDDDDGPLKDVVLDDDDEEDVPAAHRLPDAAGDSSDSDDTNSTSSAAVHLPSSSAVSIAVLPPSALAPINGSDPPPVTPEAPSAVAMAAPSSSSAAAVPLLGERKPFDDSRKLFQKLWTDEDEIELLRGFLGYTTQRGPNWTGHHHDTTAFYDQIKSKIQLDCNKNQLVEKLRRLKKKYRTAVSRISSGKDSVFKSPHDHTIFEISRKIWANSIANRPEFDDDDRNPNPSGPPFVATPHTHSVGFGIDINSPDNRTMMMMSMGTPPSRSRKRSRMMQVVEKSSRNVNFGVHEPVNAAAAAAAPGQGSVEETVRGCLTPLLKELIDKIGGGSGSKGMGSLAIPMSFPGGSGGDVTMDERWRKQQILELEVYSNRLELVQDEIKLTLEELRSRGS